MVACLETSLHAMNGRNHSLQIECNEYPLHAMNGRNYSLHSECKGTSLHAMNRCKCAAYKIQSRVSPFIR